MRLLKNFVITLGREYGSGGKAIAEALGKDLGIKVYDKNKMEMLATKENRAEVEMPVVSYNSEPNLYEDNAQYDFNPFFDSYVGYSNDNSVGFDSFYDNQSDIIRNIVEKGPAVFIGRSVNNILQEYPDVVRVFVFAPKSDRVRRIMEKEGITDEVEAEKRIRRMDKARRAYYQFYTDKKWGTTDGMDLMINSSVLGIEESAELIVDFLVRRGYVER